MNLEEAKEEAKQISKEEGCVQHVNYRVKSDSYYVDDWYDCDNTVATYNNGEKVM